MDGYALIQLVGFQDSPRVSDVACGLHLDPSTNKLGTVRFPDSLSVSEDAYGPHLEHTDISKYGFVFRAVHFAWQTRPAHMQLLFTSRKARIKLLFICFHLTDATGSSEAALHFTNNSHEAALHLLSFDKHDQLIRNCS